LPVKAIKLGAVKTARGIVILALVLGLFYLAVNFLVGDRGYLRYRKLEEERTRLKSEIESLKAQNEKLADEIERLKSDPVYIEKLARDQGLAKDGELVYQYEEDKKQKGNGEKEH